MKKIILLLILIVFISGRKVEKTPYNVTCLMKAYSEKIVDFKNDSLIWFDGTKMLWDDHKKKTFEEKIQNADVEDMFSIPYHTGSIKVPQENEDPGRIRCDAFFKKLYGQSETEVKKNLKELFWLNNTKRGKIYFNSAAVEALKAVSAELEKLPDSLKKYLQPLSGTFNWRNVADTKKLSAHAFAIAIDLPVKHADYWLWKQTAGKKIIYRNRFPLQVVEIFEKHGFIWGGRWYHYDTMHFEFRPELLPQPK